jgi:hypothetical protein
MDPIERILYNNKMKAEYAYLEYIKSKKEANNYVNGLIQDLIYMILHCEQCRDIVIQKIEKEKEIYEKEIQLIKLGNRLKDEYEMLHIM